jgi:hypothetical protein
VVARKISQPEDSIDRATVASVQAGREVLDLVDTVSQARPANRKVT